MSTGTRPIAEMPDEDVDRARIALVSPKLLPVRAATRSNFASADEQPVEAADDDEEQEQGLRIACRTPSSRSVPCTLFVQGLSRLYESLALVKALHSRYTGRSMYTIKEAPREPGLAISVCGDGSVATGWFARRGLPAATASTTGGPSAASAMRAADR